MSTPDARKPIFSVRELVFLALCTALIFSLQIALANLPNVEVVTLLVILYTLHFRKKALLVIYAFVVLEGIFYGFHIWWIMYLYIWTILWLVVTLMRTHSSALVWAVTAGFYGLFFGALCAIPYLFLGGFSVALSWWIAGIPFDLIHCVANFLLVLVLFTPLDRVMTRIDAML